MDLTQTNQAQFTIIPAQNAGIPSVTASPLVSSLDISNQRHQQLLNLKRKSQDEAMFANSQQKLSSTLLPQSQLKDLYHDKEVESGNWIGSLKTSHLNPLNSEKAVVDEKLASFNRTQTKKRRIQVMQNAPAFVLAGVLVLASVFASNLVSSSNVSTPSGANAGQVQSSVSSTASSVSSITTQSVLERTKSILSGIYTDLGPQEFISDAIDKTAQSTIQFSGNAIPTEINWLASNENSKLFFFDSSPIISAKGSSAILVQDSALQEQMSVIKPGSDIIVSGKNTYGETVKWRYSVEKNNLYTTYQKELFTDNSNSRMIFMIPKKDSLEFTGITAVFKGLDRK
jgi:hypothetical protein